MSMHCHLEQPVPLTDIMHINLRTPNLPIIESTEDLPIEPIDILYHVCCVTARNVEEPT
jgi:hypothetical protein